MLGDERPQQVSPGFVNRVTELAWLNEHAERTRGGRPVVVLIDGDAGIGKTALVRRLLTNLVDFTVLWSQCDAAESKLEFGAISQLIARVGHADLDTFPSLRDTIKQNRAPYLVGADLVGLLGRVSDSRPVAVVVDDAHWADLASAQALAFLLRRICVARVLVVLTTRSETADAADVATDWRRLVSSLDVGELMHLSGLTAQDLVVMAEELGVRPLSPLVALRIHKRTQGHPLYARTVLAKLSKEDLFGAVESVPVPSSLAAGVRRQCADLPSSSLHLLEAMAVLNTKAPLSTVAHVAAVTESAEALEPLIAAGLARWLPEEPTARAWIGHPLQRDAIYESIPPVRRRNLHTAAAAAVDQDAAMAHRVAAADSSDTTLLSDLDVAAEDAVASGDLGRAATTLLWAADLEQSREARERRRLTAAAHLLWSYKFARVEALRDMVQRCSSSPLRSCVLGRMAMMDGWFATARRHLEEALHQAEPRPESRWVASLAATGLASLSCWLGEGKDTVTIAQRAVDIASTPHLSRLAVQFLASGYLHTNGPRAALEELERGAQLPTSAATATAEHADVLAWRSSWRVLSGELRSAVADATIALRLSGGEFVGQVDVNPHYCLASAQYLLGEWDDAQINAEHAMTIVLLEEKTWAYAHCFAVASMLAAGRGRWSRAVDLVQASENWVRRYGPPQYAVYPAIAGATLAQAQANYGAMAEALRPLDGLPDLTGWPLAFQSWWRPLHVEALIGTGQTAAGSDALQRLEACTDQTPYLGLAVSWLGGWLAQEQGHLDAARQRYENGLQHPTSADDVPLLRAHLEHSYGRLLATTHERRQAVDWLRRAHNRYAEIGAQPFQQRCSDELATLGLHAPENAPTETFALTERERSVAHLIARGLTNQEAARQLYISAKTVEFHLSNVYAKLGLSSRRELRRTLSAGT